MRSQLFLIILTFIAVSIPASWGINEEDAAIADEFEEHLKEQQQEAGPPSQEVSGNSDEFLGGGGGGSQEIPPVKGSDNTGPLTSHPVASNNGEDHKAGFNAPPEQPNLQPTGAGGPNDVCNCVNYFLCDVDNGGIIDTGDVVGLIDIRLGGSNKASPCGHYFKICCQKMKETTNLPPAEPNFEHSVCGKRNDEGVGFRITGNMEGESQFGEFPWMAAIVRQEYQDDKTPLNIFVCGGSLIHPKVILTAAHCVFGKNPSELKVRLGEWDTQTPEEIYPHQDKFVSKIIVHEDYYAGALYNDVALLILDHEIKFAPNVDTVCLPPPNINFDGQTCYASGWGKDSFGDEGKYQVILKRVGVPVVPNDRCQESLRRTRLGPYFRLHDSFVCAGGELGKDTCRGDGGSPLVCKLPNSNHYVQYGIVAWGIGCGEEGTPGVYVNIPKFVPWIEEKLIGANLDTKFHKNV